MARTTLSIDPSTSLISLSDAQSYVNDELRHFFEQATRRAIAIAPNYQRLWEALEQTSLAGGKRLRPYLTYVAYQAFGGDSLSLILKIGVAEEMLHIAMLVHDDIIDRDMTRHGAPNVSGRYAQLYQTSVAERTERVRLANCAALLAGDLALSSAYQLIQTSDANDRQKLTAVGLLGEAIFNVTAGELLDTEAVFEPQTLHDPLVIYEHKTASYSFVNPLVMGASLADADTTTLEALTTFGQQLGIAYQLVDDVLGMFGSVAVTGKSITGDSREGKYTYLAATCLVLAKAEDKTLFTQLYGKKDLSDDEAATIANIVTRSGAREQTEKLAAEYAARAKKTLADIQNIDNSGRHALEAVIELCVNRTR